MKVPLSEDELREIRSAAASVGTGKIPRYPERFQKFQLVDTPPLEEYLSVHKEYQSD